MHEHQTQVTEFNLNNLPQQSGEKDVTEELKTAASDSELTGDSRNVIAEDGDEESKKEELLIHQTQLDMLTVARSVLNDYGVSPI